MPEKILVVDDDSHIRRLIRIHLSAAGYEVSDVATGEEALALATNGAFSAVLVDLILPHFGGFRLCQKLKQNVVPPPRVVIITGDDSQQTRDTAREYGADGFLAKPFAREGLLAAVAG